MILAINPSIPEYKATVRLTPVNENKNMVIRNRYQKPLINKGNIMKILLFWAISSVVFLTGIV